MQFILCQPVSCGNGTPAAPVLNRPQKSPAEIACDGSDAFGTFSTRSCDIAHNDFAHNDIVHNDMSSDKLVLRTVQVNADCDLQANPARIMGPPGIHATQPPSCEVNQYIENIVDALGRVAVDGEQLGRIKALSAELGWASESEIDDLLHRIVDLQARSVSHEENGPRPNLAAGEAGLEILLARLIHDLRQKDEAGISSERLETLSQLYHVLPASSRNRSYVLGWLCSFDEAEPIERFTELLVDDPPRSTVSIAVAFAPLVGQSRNYEVGSIFPRLLDALEHLSVAAAVLDLANFLTRQRELDRHPAAGHVTQLMHLLEMLTGRLSGIEKGELPPGSRPEQISQMVGESVALMTSLCDALALMGDRTVVESLRQASLLKHRRLRAEALSAMCHLGETQAEQPLIELAVEPVVRMRVIAYAEELELLDRIPQELTTPAAQAEGQLAMWLSHPSNMGLAPNEMQLVESRQLSWPSFEEPQDCFLFKYAYELSGQKIENVGIAGPMTHAFTQSLLNLNVADVYACFAGFQCDHEEIQELTIEQARMRKPGTIERLMSRLASWSTADDASQNAQPSFLGLFFGEPVLVAAGQHQSRAGTFIVDQQDVSWFEPGGESAAMDELAYCIYKGRKLLAAFNSPDVWPGE